VNAYQKLMGMSEQAVSRVLFPEAVTRFRDNGHSSSLDVAIEIKRPTREPGRTTPYVPLFGLAPGGVYQAPDVTAGTGELLPHPFTLTPADIPKVGGGGLLSVALSFPSPGLDASRHRDWTLPSTSPCGARTFLSPAITTGQRPFVLLQHTRIKDPRPASGL